MENIKKIMSDITSSSRNIPIDNHSTDAKSPELMTILQEDRIRVMQKRTVILLNENTYLKKQISKLSEQCKALEEKLLLITQIFSQGELNENKQKSEKGNGTIEKVAVTVPLNPLEKLQQTMWALCKSCHGKLQKNQVEEPVVFITKIELEILEKDIQTLRDTLTLREEAWNKIVDREQNYCQQLTRLAQEVITANQLADNRHEDLKKMAQTLEEKEFELKSRQKEMTHLKRIIVKQEKRRRAIIGNGNESRGGGGGGGPEINDRERKWIEVIMQQFPSSRRRQKSMGRQQTNSRHSSSRNSMRN